MELALKPVSFEQLPLLGDIRRRAIMAQPETFWNESEKKKAADAWETMDVQANFSLYRLFINHNQSAFIGWKDNYLGYLFITPEAQGKSYGASYSNSLKVRLRKAVIISGYSPIPIQKSFM